MTLRIKKAMLLTLLITSFVSQAHATDNYVKAAHEKFLATDFKNTDQVRETILAIKEGLEKAQSKVPEDFAGRDNLLKLYDQFLEKAQNERFPKDILEQAKGKKNLGSISAKLKEYAKTHGEIIPTGWSLPEEFKYLVFAQERKLMLPKGKVEYALSFFGWMQEGKPVPESIQLIRYPNDVVIDKEKSIGSWGEGVMEGETTKTFSTTTEVASNPSKEGLYLINIKMPNQKEAVNGWIIVSRMSTTDAPIVQSPAPGQVFKTATPTLRWTNYKSKNLRPFESRKRMLSIGVIQDDQWKKVWGKSEFGPGDETSFTFEKENSLADGVYSFIHSMQERWFVGDLLLQRQSATSTRFSVKAKGAK